MTTHTNCTHPATKAGRAACRRDNKIATIAGDAVARTTPAPVATSPSTTEPRRIAKVEWDRETCGRCGGTGDYPSSAWQGVCLGCNGKGRKLTRAGLAAVKAWDAYLAANHSVFPIDLQPGDVVVDATSRRTVVSVDRTIRPGGTCTIGSGDNAVTYQSLNILVEYKKLSAYTMPYATVTVQPTGEALQAAFRNVANRKGAHVTYV